MSVESYKAMLENSYEQIKACLDEDVTKLSYLADYVFDFTTYDDEASELFVRKALEVCKCISIKKTFDYHSESEENYQWYLIMCNMPFFQGKLEWGTSIRGAWWDYGATFEIDICGFYDCDDQILKPLKFNADEWLQFIEAMEGFSNG